MQDPLVTCDYQSTINAAVLVHLFVGGGKRSALILQAAQVLPVPTIDDARAQSGETACEEWGQGEGKGGRTSGQHIYQKGAPVPQILRTKTTLGETVK